MTEMRDPEGTGDLRLPPLDVPLDEEVTDFEPFYEPVVEGIERVTRNKSDDDEPYSGAWVPIPVPPKPQGEIWHYTNGAGAIGILSSRVLWATSMKSLNDSLEMEHGLALLERLLVEVCASKHIHPFQKRFLLDVQKLADQVRGHNPLFVVCASEDSDSLSQWRAYGGPTACALALDPGPMPIVVDSSQPPVSYSAESIIPAWGLVLYEPEQQRELLLRMLSFLALQCPMPDAYESLVESRLAATAPWLLATLAHCKHPSFAEEEEVRAVLQAPSEACVSFRSTKFGITPYVSLSFDDGRRRPVPRTIRAPARLPLTSSTIGPTAYGATAADGLRLLLRNNGFAHVPVLGTQAPYR